MPSDSDQLIDLAIRPLANNVELQLDAKAKLQKCLAVCASGRPEEIGKAIQSLEKADRFPRRGLWRTGLYLATLLVSLTVMFLTLMQIQGLRDAAKRVNQTSDAPVGAVLFPGLTSEQTLFLFGSADAKTESERWKPLWQSRRDEPAFLAEYASAHVRHSDRPLPPEILEAAMVLDPDNGWYPAVSALILAKSAVTRSGRSKEDVAERRAAAVVVADEKALDMSLSLIHESVRKPKFSGYKLELLSQRLAELPPREDFVSQVPLIVYVGSIRRSGPAFQDLADVLAAGAKRCADNGDLEGFRVIVSDWHELTARLVRNGSSPVDMLAAKNMAVSPLLNFRDAAESLGMDPEARRFSEMWEMASKEKSRRDQRMKAMKAAEGIFETKGSVFAGKSGPLIQALPESPPVITDADLRPGRYADHSVLSRVFGCLGWLSMMAACCLALLIRRLQPPIMRVLSVRMRDLFIGSDWVWLLALGVGLPVMWYVCFSRLVPSAPREWAVPAVSLPISWQFISFILSLVTIPVAVADWLIAKRGAVLGLACRRRWPSLLAAVAALAGVALSGVAPGAGSWSQMIIIVSRLSTGIALLLICGGLILFVFGRNPQRLRLATSCLMVLPALVCSSLVMALAIPLHHMEEKYWSRRDRLGEISAVTPAMSGHEYLVMRTLQKEALEFLGEKP